MSFVFKLALWPAGAASNTALQTRIFRLVCAATAVLSLFVILPVNAVQHHPLTVDGGIVIVGLFALFCLWDSARGRHRFVEFLFALLLTLDVVWFSNAGSQGAVGTYFFVAMLYAITVLPPRTRWMLALLVAGNAGGLLLAEYFHPALVTPFPRPEDRLADLLSGVFCGGLSLTLLVWLVVEAYQRQHRQLQEVTSALAVSEERLRLALAASQQSWFELDLGTRVATVGENPARVGWTTARFQESVGVWRERIHPDDRDRALEAFTRCAATGDNAIFEHRVRSPEAGAWKWVRVLARGADQDHTGKPRRILGTLTDITQVKEIEAQWLRRQRLESVGVLAGGVAHHLNNLLTPIVMGGDLLRTSLVRHADRTLLDDMAASARRAQTIVRELVTFSQAKDRFHGTIDALGILRQLTHAFRPQLPASIKLIEQLPTSLAPVAIDPGRFKEAIVNLCTNACEAMSEGGTLTLRAANLRLPARSGAIETLARGGEWVAVTIEDTGRGISAENLPRIFDPFFTTKASRHGPGLGLSIAYATVTAHGGTMTVVSEPGRGSTFQILLPAVSP